jgi:hypothetical protein
MHNLTNCLKMAVYTWNTWWEYWNKTMYSCANWIRFHAYNRKTKRFSSLQVPCGSKHLPQFHSWWQRATVNLWSFPLYWILWSNFPVQCQVLLGTVRTGKYSCKLDRLNFHVPRLPTVVIIHDCSTTCQASDIPEFKFTCQPCRTM